MSAFGMLVGALCAGWLLGLFYFGGLWWTVRRGALSSRLAVWCAASALLRMAAVVAAFYFVLTRGGLANLMACLGGLLIARVVITRRIRLKSPGPLVS